MLKHYFCKYKQYAKMLKKKKKKQKKDLNKSFLNL